MSIQLTKLLSAIAPMDVVGNTESISIKKIEYDSRKAKALQIPSCNP